MQFIRTSNIYLSNFKWKWNFSFRWLAQPSFEYITSTYPFVIVTSHHLLRRFLSARIVSHQFVSLLLAIAGIRQRIPCVLRSHLLSQRYNKIKYEFFFKAPV